MLKFASCVGGHGDNDFFAFLGIFIINFDFPSVIILNLHHQLVHCWDEGDILGFIDEIVIINRVAGKIDTVRIHELWITIRFSRRFKQLVSNIVNGISLVILACDDDDIIFHHFDAFALLTSSLVAQCQGSMVFLSDTRLVLLTSRSIVDGHVLFAHVKDQHVFVLNGRSIHRKQQTKIVELRTGVATRLSQIIGYRRNNERQCFRIRFDSNRFEIGLPAIIFIFQLANNNRI